jgi:hypothetical protein
MKTTCLHGERRGMVYARVGHWVVILLECAIRVSSWYVQFLLPTTHTMLQANIEDDPEKRSAARDSNRERKRRQRWHKRICILITCLLHGHCRLCIGKNHRCASSTIQRIRHLSETTIANAKDANGVHGFAVLSCLMIVS